MGIFEFHFHESEFTFAPSITNKGGEATEDGEDAAAELTEPTDGEPVPVSPGARPEPSGSGGAKRGVAVLVGLAFLVGAAAVAKKAIDARRSGDEAEDRLGTESVEKSIEIAD